MREKIAEISKENHRSMNSEIIDRLALSIERDEQGDLTVCSGQLIPDTGLSFSSAIAGGNPPLN
ncbi:Arc family DNA-binding protein, partial [Pseudomonas monteilii]|uniref:Arc family DNA-binding protein n=1 Tax=Pseudomonas monteilii TaxID=76759 RepID=UPI001E29FF02